MPFLYHPFAVHFPIALWLTSALVDAIYLRRGDPFYARAARLLIGLGLLSAAISIALGFVDFRALGGSDVGRAFVDLHRLHSRLAYAAVAVYLVSFVLRWRRANLSRGIIGALLVLGAGLIVSATWFGSQIRKVM